MKITIEYESLDELLLLADQIRSYKQEATVVPLMAEGEPKFGFVHQSELSVRARNALADAGLWTIDKVLLLSRNELLKTPGISKVTAKEIGEYLVQHGHQWPLARRATDKP